MIIVGRISAFLFSFYVLFIFGCMHVTIPAPTAPAKPVGEIVVEDSTINMPVILTSSSLAAFVNGMLTPDKGSDKGNGEDASVSRIQRFLNRQIKKIDDDVSKNDFIKERVSTVWGALQHPIPLTDSLSLMLNPQAVHVSPSAQREKEDALTVFIGLVARPKIITNDAQYPSVAPAPCFSNAPAGSGFHIALDSDLAYDVASDELTKRLEGRVFKRDGSTIKIGTVKVYGSGESAVLQIRFAGTMNGTIYLRGIPAYDETSKHLYIRNLDYTVETRQVLVKAGDWLFHTRLREVLEGEATWYIGDSIDRLRYLLIKALNRKLNQHVAIAGTIDSISLAAVGVTDTALRAILVLDGTAELNVF
jgi:hypothetical protein